MWSIKVRKPLHIAVALTALFALLAAACTSAAPQSGGVSQAEYDAAKAQLKAKEQEAAKLQADTEQLKKQLAGGAPSVVVQAGQLQPAPAAAQPSGWDTAESIRGGLKVLATYDSSGPAAWDPVKHPLVYFTSEGQGYAHRPSKTNKFPGVQIIDATTKQVVASPVFDLGYKEHGNPHGLGVSPDGKWIYVATTDGPISVSAPGRLLIVDAKTLKLHMSLVYANNKFFHHASSFKDWQGRDRVLLQDQSWTKFIVDPKEDNRVVKAITLADVGPMGHPYSTVDPLGKFLYVAMSSPEIREGEFPGASIAKVNLETGAAKIIPGTGNWPIGMAHTADGKFTYVADGTGSRVYKIDNATDTIVGRSSAGVVGPYGLALNWDETELWVMGKGEGSHNTGGVLGVIDTKIFRPTNVFNQPVNIGGSIIDHGILHPDPAVNELWVSSAGTWETIIVDLTKKEVKARIPSPHGGDTHSGAFVRYNPDFIGEVLADMGGPQRAMYATKKDLAAKAAAPR